MQESYLNQGRGGVSGNYAATCENWRKIFQEMDKEELIARFHLKNDEKALYVTYYSEEYRLDRKTGMAILAKDPERLLSFNTVIAIYNAFHYAKPEAKIKGEFVPFRSVKRAAPFDPAFQKTVLQPLAKTFSGQGSLLKKACLALHGKPISQGDVGYVVDAFAWMPITMVFWDGDDEFDAQANILFDADITDFVHEETVVCIAADLVRRLSEEAGLGKVENLI